jgi:hypothetical protein
MQIGIAAIPDEFTTARYFERAAISSGHSVRSIVDLSFAEVFDGLDFLLVIDPFLRTPGLLRSAPCPVAGYLIDVHQELPTRVAYSRYFDYVFVAQPEFIPAFRNEAVQWLPLACEPEAHFAADLDRIYDIGFVGKLGNQGSERRAILERVFSAFSTNDWTRSYNPVDMGRVYSQSKIVFNKSINGDVNMRFFEGLASGALLITDRIGNGMEKLGQEGVHHVAYDGVEDALSKISYYLSHDEERKSIAAAGQKLAFESHTYRHRLNSIISSIEMVPSQGSLARQAKDRQEGIWRSECFKLQGASLGEIGSLIGEAPLSCSLVGNASIAAARGIVRPLKQKMRNMRKK